MADGKIQQSSKCQHHISDICNSTYQVVQLGDLLLVVILDGGFVALFELSEGNTNLDLTTKTLRKLNNILPRSYKCRYALLVGENYNLSSRSLGQLLCRHYPKLHQAHIALVWKTPWVSLACWLSVSFGLAMAVFLDKQACLFW